MLEFKNELIDAVLDRFGLDAAIVPQDAAHFGCASVAVSPQFFGWLCAYGDGARIISPPEVADSAHLRRGDCRAVWSLANGTDAHTSTRKTKAGLFFGVIRQQPRWKPL